MQKPKYGTYVASLVADEGAGQTYPQAAGVFRASSVGFLIWTTSKELLWIPKPLCRVKSAGRGAAKRPQL